ncbi:MAG: hypothetical protein V4495_14485 [Pseudomonadota bacterium]
MLKKTLHALLVASALIGNSALAEDYATTACSQYGQPEFVFSSGPQKLIAADVAWFKKVLEDMVASGEKFKDAETILVGSMVLKIAVTKDGTYRLLEPDMKSMPIKFVDSIATTLKIIRRQRETVASLDGTEVPDFSPLTGFLLIEENALQAPAMVMSRHNAKRLGGTGWVLSDATKKPANTTEKMQAMSVYEAILYRPDMLDFLALPEGYTVFVKNRRDFTLAKEGKPMQVRKGSYLDLLKQ